MLINGMKINWIERGTDTEESDRSVDKAAQATQNWTFDSVSVNKSVAALKTVFNSNIE